jgi:crotonobetainyl-CoA:carnitine CoA-transferase CaiB-like acyl-CoA transferase
MLSKPFKQLKVIELAGVLAGPAVGMFFAELGAKVIKIENKNTGGDVTRAWKLPSEDPNSKTSAYFYAVNYGKKHIFLNLKNESDYKKIVQLMSTADLVISNFKNGDDKLLKLDYSTLKKINPRLIYASLSGFGEDSNRVAFDLVMQAETGFMSMNGSPDSGPIKMPVACIDLFAAHQLKAGILTALWRREKTGKGMKVSTSLFDSAIASLANQATNWLIAHQIPERTGSLHPNIAPYGEMFQTKDKYDITLAIGSDRQFQKLCEILELKPNKKFERNTQRIANRKLLYTVLYEKIKAKKMDWLARNFEKHEIPYGQIKNLKTVFSEQKSRHLLLDYDQSNTIKIPKSVSFKLTQ